MAVSRIVATSRLKMRVVEEGDGPAVLLLHGFPESAYSWRHQIPVLAEAGFRAVAPDQRGYGATDAPEAVEAYDIVELSADVVSLLDALHLNQAVLVGHDWGAPVAWNTAMLHPDRVRAVVGMSVPHIGRAKEPPLQKMKRRLGDAFFYMLYFQEPGVAERELEADVRESLRVFYSSISGDADPASCWVPQRKGAKLFDSMKAPDGLPAFLTEGDLQEYTETFRRSGFRGPLNWYRNFDRSHERTAHLEDCEIRQPALFIAGDRDPVILFNQAALTRMPVLVPDLKKTLLLPGAGHWIQQERPNEVNAALLEFLRAL